MMLSSSSSSATSASTPESSALAFLRLAGKLKGTVRTGWVYSGVGESFTCKRVESVSDHSWRMSVATLLYEGVPVPEEEGGGGGGESRHYDVPRMCQMAALHDIAEALTGDIAPADRVSKAEKARRESEAMATIGEALAGWGRGGARTLEALMEEYEARESPESVAVKDLDMLEMIVQADAYEALLCDHEERGGADAARGEEPGVSSKRRKAADGGVLDGGDDCVKSLDLSDFFRTTSGKFRTAPARAVADELTRQRDLRRGEGLS